MEFFDTWIWLIFIAIGLLMILSELIVGVDTGLDLVILGSAVVLGGLVTWPAHSWVLTLLVTSIICIAYILLVRRIVRRWVMPKKTITNVDAVIGRNGVVLEAIQPNRFGKIKVGGEEWRARADEEIPVGEVVMVTGLQGVTLNVTKSQGG